jgi:hypothetical protein
VPRSEVAGKAVRRKNGPTGNAGLRGLAVILRNEIGERDGAMRDAERRAGAGAALDERGRHDGTAPRRPA